ncbi:MAG: hypothetical protein KC620_16120, partial [Myxococcales bacterium]|nr:hypothetical protein [Myxococcales bacterium]
EAVEVQQLAADAPPAPAAPARPEPPPPMSDEPDALAATMAMQEDPARPLPPMPAPISARMAAPAHAVDDTPPIDEVDAVPDDSVADQFSPATVMAMPPQKKKGGGAMVAVIIVVAVLALGGGGFAAWWFLLRGPAEAPQTPTTEVEAPPVELSFAEKLGKQIEDGQARLPRVPGAEALAEATWVAGGPEGMATSLGPVTGMPSTLIRDNTVESDDDGEWVTAMRLRLSEGSPGADSMLLIGVPADVTARDFLRMANAGRMAGHGRFGLVVEKAEAEGERGMIPFWLHPRTANLPESGAVLVRIGRIGLHVSAQNGAGEVVSEGEPSLPRQGAQLDLDALGKRLAELKAAHPDIKRVIVFPIGDMELTALAGLMAQVHAGADGARFDELAIALLK